MEGQIWSSFAAVWEKMQRKIPMHSTVSLVKGQLWSSFAAVWENSKERHVY